MTTREKLAIMDGIKRKNDSNWNNHKIAVCEKKHSMASSTAEAFAGFVLKVAATALVAIVFFAVALV